jgi:hypothetical protein
MFYEASSMDMRVNDGRWGSFRQSRLEGSRAGGEPKVDDVRDRERAAGPAGSRVKGLMEGQARPS